MLPELAILQNPKTMPFIAVLVLAKVKEPLVEMAPAAVVVAFPPTHKFPDIDSFVEEAFTRVVTPVTLRVEYKVAAPVTCKVLEPTKVPKVAKLPLAAVVVAKPLISRAPLA